VARLGSLRFWHGGTIASLAVSPDGKMAASGGWDRKATSSQEGEGVGFDRRICLWDLPTGRRLRGIETPNDVVACLEFSPDGKTLAVGVGSQICLLDVTRGKELRGLGGHDTPVTLVRFNTEGTELTSMDQEGNRFIWDTRAGKCLRRLPLPPAPRLAAEGEKEFHDSYVFSGDGKLIAYRIVIIEEVKWKKLPREKELVRVCDADTGKQVSLMEHPRSGYRVPVFSPDNRFLATESGRIHLWDVRRGKAVHTIDNFGLPGDICGLTFAPDGNTLLSVHQHLVLRLWDTKTGRIVRELIPDYMEGPVFPRHVPRAFAFSPDSRTLLGGIGATVRLWDVQTGKEPAALPAHRLGVSKVRFSADGGSLSTGCDLRYCRWETTGWREVSRIDRMFRKDLPNGERVLATSSDGKVVVTVSEDGSVQSRDGVTGQPISAFGGNAKGGWQAVLAPDGKRVFLAREVSGSLVSGIHDVATGKVVSRLPLGGTPVFSPDGTLLAGFLWGGAIHVMDVVTGKEVSRLNARRGETAKEEGRTPTLLGFSPDGQYLATAPSGDRSLLPEPEPGEDGSLVRIFHVKLGTEVSRVMVKAGKGGTDRIACLTVSPDGRLLATGQYGEATVRVWEAASGQERGRLKGHQDSVLSLDFSPNGKLLASGSEDGTVLVWDCQGPVKQGSRKAERTAKELAAAWDDLAADASTADGAIWALADAPTSAVPFLKAGLVPVTEPDPRRVARLIADLDSDDFAIREKASRELEGMHQAARPALAKALEGRVPPEVSKRLEELLQKVQAAVPPRAVLRQIRAVEALERMGTPEARRLLEALAAGLPEARLTTEAKGALGRLGKRPAP
jgi:WD40 repeat protein